MNDACKMAGTTTWGNYGFNITKPHCDMMTLGLMAGRGAKACQGPAACPAPSTLGDAGARIFWRQGTTLLQNGLEFRQPPPDLAKELLEFQPGKQDRKATKSFGNNDFIVFETSWSLKHHFEAMSASGQYGSSMMLQGTAS